MKTRPLALRRPLLAATLLLAAAALLLASCTTYRWGTDFPRGQRTIALEPVVNLSQEEALSTLLRDTLAERIAQTPGLRLAPPMGEPELRLAVKVLPLDQGKAARARTRKSIASHDDSDSYQTVLYRLTMSCEYTATPADPALPPRSGKVEVTAPPGPGPRTKGRPPPIGTGRRRPNPGPGRTAGTTPRKVAP